MAGAPSGTPSQGEIKTRASAAVPFQSPKLEAGLLRFSSRSGSLMMMMTAYNGPSIERINVGCGHWH